MTNADTVLAAMRSWGGRNGECCAPLAELVVLTDLHETAIRRAQAELIEDGRIVFTGRRHRGTAIYKLKSDPDARQRPSPKPPEPEELPEELRRMGLSHLYPILDSIDETEIGEPDLPGGPCGECEQHARRRYSLGLFVLCRECRMRRYRAGVLATAEGESGPTLDSAGAGLGENVPAPSPSVPTASSNGHDIALVEDLTERIRRPEPPADDPYSWPDPDF